MSCCSGHDGGDHDDREGRVLFRRFGVSFRVTNRIIFAFAMRHAHQGPIPRR